MDDFLDFIERSLLIVVGTRLYFEDVHLDMVDGPIVIEMGVSHASGGTRAELA